MAAKMEFIHTRYQLAAVIHSLKKSFPKHLNDIVVRRDTFDAMMAKEEIKWNFCKTVDKDGNIGEKVRQSFTNVWLIDEFIMWLYPEGWKAGDTREYNWHYLGLKFYFPKQNVTATVSMKQCIGAFSKAQRINIMSYIKDQCKTENIDLKTVQLPNQYKTASRLVGAAMDKVSHEELAEAYLNPDKYRNGWIYRDADLHYLTERPDKMAAIAERDQRIFFP